MFDGGRMDTENQDGTDEEQRLLVLVKPSIVRPKALLANK